MSGDGRLVALGLLRSGRGVPVHAEAFAVMARRWEKLDDQLAGYRFGLEDSRAGYRPEHLLENLSNASAVCYDLAVTGQPYGSPPLPPTFAVAYRDTVEWFEQTRQSVLRDLPVVPADELAVRAETIRQHGLERIYELDTTAVRVPELDGSELVGRPDEARGLPPYSYDPAAAERRLAALVGPVDESLRLHTSAHARNPAEQRTAATGPVRGPRIAGRGSGLSPGGR